MAGARQTVEVVEARREEVETVMLTGNWTLRTQAALGRRHGVTSRQIRDDARILRRRWAADSDEITPGQARAAWFARVRAAQVHAQQAGHLHTVARLLALEGRAMGHLEPARVQVDHRMTMADPRELAASVLQALPMIHEVLGLPAPAPMIVDMTEDD